MLRSKSLRLALSATLLFAAGDAFAASCKSLQQEMNGYDTEASDLAGKYPGTTFAFGACLAIGTDTYSKTQDSEAAAWDFAKCVGLACIPADDYGECVSVNVQLFAYVIKYMIAQNEAKRLSCAQ